MNTRLQQFIAAENISQAQFADSLNVARAGISHILAGRNKPSYDFITALLLKYPKLNLEWLMFGKGKMYKEESPEPAEPKFQEDLFSFQQDQSLSPSFETDIDNKTSNIDINTKGNSLESIVKQRNVKKIIILFDDNTFQEL